MGIERSRLVGRSFELHVSLTGGILCSATALPELMLMKQRRCDGAEKALYTGASRRVLSAKALPNLNLTPSPARIGHGRSSQAAFA
jgi:hypothetical protein